MRDKKADSELITAQEGEVFSLWDLPSFDTPIEEGSFHIEQAEPEPASEPEEEVRVEEVVAEEVKPLTLDEVEAIRQDAWNEGFSTGEKDGFHAGQLKAAKEAEVVLQGKVQVLEKIMHEFFEPIARQDQELEEAMLDLVLQISQQVIQRELKIDSSQIKQVVRECLKLLPMGSEAVRVHVNPQDFERIKALRERHEGNWRIVEDDDLLPGGCRFESLDTQINASIETRIEKIATQILEQQRELKNHPLPADLDVSLEVSEPVAATTDDSASEHPASEQPTHSSSPAVDSADNSAAPTVNPAEPEPEPEPEITAENNTTAVDTAEPPLDADPPPSH